MEMRDWTSITRVREAVGASSCHLLDRPVLVRSILSEVAEVFQDHEAPVKFAVTDVPIASLFSINRENEFWFEGDTWRDIVMSRLTGENWPASVFEYFEGEIRDKKFPPNDSRAKLDLTSYGGVTACDCGNHRLAAAQGAEANLQKVYVGLMKIDRARVAAARRIASELEAELAVCVSPTPCVTIELGRIRHLLRAKSRKSVVYFNLGDMRLIWDSRRPVLSHVLSLVLPVPIHYQEQHGRCLDLQRWTPVPPVVLKTWEGSSWFDAAFVPGKAGG